MEVLLAVPIQLRTPAQRAQLRELISASSQTRRRKRKKRRKRRTPRTSSRSLCGRARRRQRQWHVSGSPGDVLLRAVFSVVVRPVMPCIMAGMDLRDSCSGLIKAGIYGYVAPRAVFLSLVCRPRMLGILAGTDLKDSCSGMYKAGFSGVSAPRAVLPEAYRKIGLFGRWRGFFFGPLYLEVTCSCFCLRSTGLLFSGRCLQEWFQYSALFLVRQRSHVRHQSRGFLEEFHAFLREGRTFGS